MPRISDRIISAVVYVYPTYECARRGDAAGGTGFLVCLPMEGEPEAGHLFVVTASHVVGHAAPGAWIRINRSSGETECVEIGGAQWIHHPSGDDVAAAPINIDIEPLDVMCIPPEWFLTRELAVQVDLGPGDEVFFVGRLKHYDGGDSNRPSARFGNLSMMPTRIRLRQSGMGQESFVVEARSLSGYSGSAVFVHFPPMTPRPSVKLAADQRHVLERRGAGPYLLGVDVAHLGSPAAIRDAQGEPVSEGWQVDSNSGMLAVVPAWKVAELFETPEVEAILREDRAAWAAQHSGGGQSETGGTAGSI